MNNSHTPNKCSHSDIRLANYNHQILKDSNGIFPLEYVTPLRFTGTGFEAVRPDMSHPFEETPSVPEIGPEEYSRQPWIHRKALLPSIARAGIIAAGSLSAAGLMAAAGMLQN